MQDLGVLPGYTWTAAYAANADGSVVVGNCSAASGGNSNYRAFRWTSSGGLGTVDAYGNVPGPSLPPSLAYAVSADGSVVAGEGYNGAAGRAFRWTAATGMLGLGGCPPCLGPVRGASGDGTVFVGNSCSGNECISNAWRWTTAGTTYLIGPFASSPTVLGVSGDGNTGVGFHTFNNGSGLQACRWTADGAFHDLAPMSLTGPQIALAANFDGSIIVGGTGDNQAFIWTEALGALDLDTVLSVFAAPLSGWTLVTATGVSTDGATVVGQGTHVYDSGGQTRTEGWVATIPLLLSEAPSSRTTCLHAAEVMSAAVVGSAAPFTFSWRKNGIPVLHDGRVSAVVSPGGRRSTLTIASFRAADIGTYDCVIAPQSNLCWSITTPGARVSACIADFNCSGSVSVQDIFDYLATYFTGDLDADINGSGAVSVQDIFDFLAAYFAGCQ